MTQLKSILIDFTTNEFRHLFGVLSNLSIVIDKKKLKNSDVDIEILNETVRKMIITKDVYGVDL